MPPDAMAQIEQVIAQMTQGLQDVTGVVKQLRENEGHFAEKIASMQKAFEAHAHDMDKKVMMLEQEVKHLTDALGAPAAYSGPAAVPQPMEMPAAAPAPGGMPA
jgi:septation ring formation regulator EzrA